MQMRGHASTLVHCPVVLPVVLPATLVVVLPVVLPVVLLVVLPVVLPHGDARANSSGPGLAATPRSRACRRPWISSRARGSALRCGTLLAPAKRALSPTGT